MAELTAEWRAALMAYCRIDDLEPGDEDLLAGMYDAAVNYMADAGVSEPPDGTKRRAQYDLCIKAMVLSDWDSRGAASAGTIYENPAFRRRLNQLKRTEPVSDLDT